jgi:hypothetical protein
VSLQAGTALDDFNASFLFSDAITAADFTPAWFQDIDQGTEGTTIMQLAADTLQVTFRDRIASGDQVNLVNQPAYVFPGGSVNLA